MAIEKPSRDWVPAFEGNRRSGLNVTFGNNAPVLFSTTMLFSIMSASPNSVLEKVEQRSRASSVQRVTARCGVEAWLVEDYAVPIVALDFAMTGGGSQDPAQKNGAAVLLAGLLDEGAGDLDAEAFQQALDDKAIELSFGAQHDYIEGRARTLVKNTQTTFDLLRLAVNTPRLDSAAFERVRSQVQAAIRRDANDPNSVAAKAWNAAAFPNHPYGRPLHGTLQSIAAVTRDDLDHLHKRSFNRQGLKIAVVGALSAAELSTHLDAVFGDLPADGGLTPVAYSTVHGLGERTILDLDIPQATIRFGLTGIARRDKDFAPAYIVNHILGGGVFSARLFKEVREKRGLAYSVHSGLASGDHAAIFSGSTSTKNERALESLQVIEEEIAKLAAEGPTDDELEKAKKYLMGSYALQFDSSSKIASQLIAIQRDGYDPLYLDERNRMIAAVTIEDAKRVAKRLFAGQKLLVTIAGRPVGLS
jgi:zinc protease